MTNLTEITKENIEEISTLAANCFLNDTFYLALSDEEEDRFSLIKICSKKKFNMNAEEVRDYCLNLKNTTESFPFDDVSLVFKIENKMYLLIPLDAAEAKIAVKCDPEQAEMLRDRYSAVEPAYHFNKKYWNNIYMNKDMPDDEIKHWINHSYHEVIRKLPKKVRELYADK